MAAQEGQCPTCGNTITIPILDRYGRLIDPKTRQIIKQDPHPVHAYAAAGERAPAIIRGPDGKQIDPLPALPAGSARSPPTTARAAACPSRWKARRWRPPARATGSASRRWCWGSSASPRAASCIPPLLAIIFGIIGYNQVARSGAEGGGKGMAIAGIIMGVLGGYLRP